MRPLIIGHRGASAIAPENTLAAFKLAMEAGADGIEFDVRLAGDHVPVVIHDADLRRTGLHNLSVRVTTVRELQTVDVGTWFNRRFPRLARAEYSDERIPTLEEVLEMTVKYDASLYLEMKCKRGEERALSNAVAHQILARNLVGRIVVESFSLDAICEIKSIAPEIKTAALFEPKITNLRPSIRTMLEKAAFARADEIALHRSFLNRRSVERVHRAGLPIVVWTVDTLTWARRATRYGFRAVICNHPARMRAFIDSLPEST